MSCFNRTILMTYKHKMHAVDSKGNITSNADVDFYINEVTSFWVCHIYGTNISALLFLVNKSFTC